VPRCESWMRRGVVVAVLIGAQTGGCSSRLSRFAISRLGVEMPRHPVSRDTSALVRSSTYFTYAQVEVICIIYRFQEYGTSHSRIN
jgi:hypothetical protein